MSGSDWETQPGCNGVEPCEDDPRNGHSFVNFRGDIFGHVSMTFVVDFGNQRDN